jgi:cytochrome c oxidase assembly factor CtaG
MFLATAVLFWWPVLGTAPRWRPPAPLPARLAYLVLAAFQGSALGLLLAASPEPLYAAYAAAEDALEDQARGGTLMWGLAALADMAAVLLTTAAALSPSRPRSG